MSHQAVPLIADWLADATYGLGAMLALLPRDVGADVPPPITIADETRDAWLARKELPQSVRGPVAAVMLAEDATWDAPSQRAARTATEQAGQVAVAVVVMVRQADSDTGVRHAADYLRAARWSLLLLHDPANAARRQRHGVELATCAGFRQATLNAERGDTLLVATLITTYRVRETVPRITPDP